MDKLIFGNDVYHLNEGMVAWCRENIGKGGWVLNRGIDSDSWLWEIESAFGYTGFSFKNQSDKEKFIAEWMK